MPPVNATGTDGVWVVVPAYNEAARIRHTLEELVQKFPNVIVVDDGSPDESGAIARSCGAWVLRHPINRGQGAALQTGIDFALIKGATTIVTFDSDGQHDPADIPAMLAPLAAGEADVALGSRFLGRTVGMPFSRWVILKLAVLFTRVVSRIQVTDTHNGLRAFTRAAAQAVRIRQDRMAHASEILDEVRRLNLRYREVPVTIRYTASTLTKGQSSLNAARVAWQFLMGKVVK